MAQRLPEKSSAVSILMKSKKSSLLWFVWLPVLMAIDQWTKWWMTQHLILGESITLFPGLRLTLTHNYGVAFGMFNENVLLSRILLLGIAMAISIFLGVWLYRTPAKERLMGFSLTLILGGALGNIIDRFMYGHVIDFIDVYYKTWHFWTFNIADSLITMGAFFMILELLFDREASKKP